MTTENRTTYSACHVFLGESKISFEEPYGNGAGAKPAKPAAPTQMDLPSEIQFTLVFPQDMKTAATFAGDTIAAKLKHAIKVRGKTLVPAGAPVVLRVMRMQEYLEPVETTQMVLKVESMDVSTRNVRFAAVPHLRRMTTKESRLAPGLTLIRRDMLPRGGFAASSAEFNFEGPKPDARAGIGKGFEMIWTTAPH